MPFSTPRSFAPQFRLAGFALGAVALLLLLLSFAFHGSPDAPLLALAHGCRVALPWVVGLALICALLAYALRPGEDVAASTAMPTEFSPDLTDFARSAMPSELPPRRDTGNDSTLA